jgi:transposase-like protein
MNLTDPIFTDKDAAREYLEAQRWPDGVVCTHCGCTGKIKKLEGKSHRPGLYQCGDCRKQFTVTVGTVFERSKVPLSKWLLATHLMVSWRRPRRVLRSPTPPLDRRYLQNRLVHVPSHPRGHA